MRFFFNRLVLFSIVFVIWIFVGLLSMFSCDLFFSHREEFQQKVIQIDRSELTCFSFSKEEFDVLKWTEEFTEFESEGRMYDVASVEQAEGVYKVYCESDWIEDLYIDLLKSDQKSKNKFPQLQLSDPVNPVSVSFPKWNNNSIINFYHKFFASVVLEHSTPPPRFFGEED